MNITDRQDQPEHLERLAAYSHRYRVAGRWRMVRMTGTLALAVVVPIVAFAEPTWADRLAALAALWLILGRTAFSQLERNSYIRAANMHEYYDCELFNLPWNDTLAGARPRAVDIAADAAKIPNRARLLKWYEVDVGGLPWPADVLLCQMQSSSWSRRDHEVYGAVLVAIAVLWSAGTLSYAFVTDLSLQDFLVRLFLPAAPALLDFVELATAHFGHARDRRNVEDVATAAWQQHQKGDSVTVEMVRRVQDSTFQLRRDQPRVPNLIYRLRRPSSSRVTVAAAAAIRGQR